MRRHWEGELTSLAKAVSARRESSVKAQKRKKAIVRVGEMPMVKRSPLIAAERTVAFAQERNAQSA